MQSSVGEFLVDSDDAPPSVKRPGMNIEDDILMMLEPAEGQVDEEEDLIVNQASVVVPSGYGWSNIAEQRRPYNRPIGLVNAGASMMNYIEKEEIGQGAFGVVYKAFEEKNPAKFVAIKRMKSVRLGMGIPQDAYREMKILREISKIVKDGLSTPEKQGANHIVKLERVYMSHDANSNAMLNLVYNYAEHDLAEIIRYHRLKQVRISNRMIKSIMFQLLKGLDFLHRNWIMHRDIKPANILIMDDSSSQGTVQIGDFGLARIFQDPLRPLSDDGDVVTIWYRAPELLLGSKHYTKAVDIWAVGAIFGELFHTGAIFPGKDNTQRGALQTDQLERIFFLLGKPTPLDWPEIFHCQFYEDVCQMSNPEFKSRLLDVIRVQNDLAADLLKKMLTFDPNQRITAEQALSHPYFRESPLPSSNCFLDDSDRKIEYPNRDVRKQHMQQLAARQQHQQQQKMRQR